MNATLHISHLADPAALQHVQEAFAVQRSLAILLFDADGERVTHPSLHCTLPAELAPALSPFLDFILTNPPHFADLGLRDGNAVFASFFNGIFHRAILPLMVQRQLIGAVQLVSVHDLETFDLGRWRYILDGFSWNDVSYLAFLDAQPRAPLNELVHQTAWFRTQLTDLLEGGYSRFRKQFRDPEPREMSRAGAQEMVTNREGDILAVSPAIAELLHYDASDEMVGLNAIEHLTIDLDIQERLRDILSLGEAESQIEALIQSKDGLLLRVTWLLILDRDDEGQEVGLRWQILRSSEVRKSRPEILPELLREISREQQAAAELTRERMTRDIAVGPPVDPPVEPPQETDSGSPEEPGTAAATLPAESLGFLEELAYPLFAVDGENRILVWNQRMVELLRISALAVLGIDFSNLLVGESQKQWHQWLFEFRINPDLKEVKPGSPLFVLDNSGEVYAIRLELAKTELPESQVITATIHACEKSVPPPAPAIAARPLEPAKPAGRPALPPREEPADALEALSRLLERQWQPLAERLRLLVQPAGVEPALRDEARILLQDAEALTRFLQQVHYIAGEFEITASPVPIVPILHHAANTQERLFSQSAPTHWQVADEKVLVQGDTVMLLHAMVYLLDYIRKVMEEGMPLRIRIQTAPERSAGLAEGVRLMMIEVAYTDHLSPWPAEERKNQAAGSFRDFGLAAMQAIIQAHHGVARIVTAEFDQRAFQLYLPLASAAPVAESGKTILVVDDEPGILQMNALMLGHAGYTVLTAMERATALQLLQEHRTAIRAILLDWKLENTTGRELAGEIARICPVPLILTSGYLPDKEIKAVMDEHHARFVQKPYTTTLLLQTVAAAIGEPPRS